MQTEYYNESQYLFDRNLRGFGIILLVIIYGLIFSPICYSSYWIISKFTGQQKLNSMYLLLTAAGSLFIYWIIWILKGMILYFQGKKNLWCIPLFILCTGFTCLAPAIVCFLILYKNVHTVVGLVLSAIPFFLAYFHYQFHVDGSPKIARPAYHLGILLGSLIL